ACLAARERRFSLSNRVMCDAILEGYGNCLAFGGRPIVLAERYAWLRSVALGKLRDPKVFWRKLLENPLARDDVPRLALLAALPEGAQGVRICRRVAGVGSLGRPRFLAIAECRGGFVAREAKAWIPSAATRSRPASHDIATRLLPRIARAPDPGFAIR